jgi:alpha-L-rhamnosidase
MTRPGRPRSGESPEDIQDDEHWGENVATASAPTEVRFEHWAADQRALGVGNPRPRLSWIVPAAEADYAQTAYEVEITQSDSAPEVFRVESVDQVLVPWPGRPLRSRERARVRIRVGDGDDWSPWSEPADVEAGLLGSDDWIARFVSARELGGLDMPAPVLRARLDVSSVVVRARLYITAHGIYLPFLNGVRVGDQQLAPGWTSYRHRLRYQTYDVTDLVRDGRNELEVLLGNGWFRGRLGFAEQRALYGDRLALLAQLEVTTADGAVKVLATDDAWTATEGSVLSDDLYDGQHVDLRRAPLREGGEDGVEVLDEDLSRLVAPDGPPVRITEVRPVVSIVRSPAGATLVDFGQNVVGWVRLRVDGHEPGEEIVVRHAEVLDDGELGVRPLRTAKATDRYLLAGGVEILEPSLTFHGFRYAEVTGVEDLRHEDVQAIVVGSDLRRTGWFESSEPMLDRFHDNVVWGTRGNFLDIPTDCPQRDERLGWTGDISVFSPTACFLFDTAGFLTSWLADLAADQFADGTIPFVIPDVLPREQPPAAGWGDAATVVPWVLYQRFGDLTVLTRQLPSMRAWVDRVASVARANHLWIGGFQFGDWLDPTAPPDQPFLAQADADVVATAHFARSAEILSEATEAVGERDAAKRYAKLAERVRAAFAEEYVTSTGRVLSDAQTAYALSLEWNLLPSAPQREHAGRRLADLVRTAAFRIGTGFLGTPVVTDALTSVGEIDLAYRLMLERGCPSWLYPVTMGATTVWERWDSLLPDGRINPGEMTSFNHYALGAVADWLHRTVAGLAPAAPGYREILVRPRPGGGLTSAAARHITPYGPASTAWHRRDGYLEVEVTIPVGCKAVVHLPGEDEPRNVGHGTHNWRTPDRQPQQERDTRTPSTIRELVDRPSLWNAVVAAATETDVARDDVEVASRLRRFLDHPTSVLGPAITAFRGQPGAAEFGKRLDAILAP